MTPDSEADRKHTARGARTNLLTLLGQASFFAFGATAARLFGQAAWGAYTTAYAWIDVLVRSSLLAGDKAVLVFVPSRRAHLDEAGAARAFGSSLRVALAMSVVGAIAMAIASIPIGDHSDPLDGRAMRQLAPVVVIATLGLLVLAATMAAKVLRYNLAAKGIAEPALTFGIAAIAGALAPDQLLGLTLAPIIAALAVLAIGLWGAHRLYAMRDVWRAARGAIDREVVRFALPLAASEFLNILAMRLGSFVLLGYVAVDQRALFNTALLLAGTVSYVRGLFDTVLGPLAAESWANGDHARLAANLKSQTATVLMFAVPYASLFIVAGDVVLSLYGPGFPAGHTAMIWLALGHIINATLGLTGWVLMAALKTRAMLLNNIAKVALELVLCLALIPHFGIDGAAFATFAAIALLQGLQVYEVYKLSGIHPFSPRLAWCGLTGAAVIVAEVLVLRAIDPTMRQITTILVVAGGAVVYLAVTWRRRMI